MSRNVPSHEPSATRAAILEAAWRLLEREGPSVSLEQIAVLAGVSRQAVYLHFQSRTNLLVALVSHVSESLRMPEKLRDALAAPSAEATLQAFVQMQTEHNARVAVAAAALDAARRSDAAAAEAWQDRMRVRRQAARKVIQRLSADGRLRRELSIDEATDMLWELLSVRTWEDFVVSSGWSHARFAKRLHELVRRAVLVHEG